MNKTDFIDVLKTRTLKIIEEILIRQGISEEDRILAFGGRICDIEEIVSFKAIQKLEKKEK